MKATKKQGFSAMWEKFEGTMDANVGPFTGGAARTIAEALFRRTSTTQPEEVAFQNAATKALSVMREWCATEGILISE